MMQRHPQEQHKPVVV